MELRPIKIKADDATRAQYVRNILATYALASDDQRARGAAWYPNAHTLALTIACGNARMGAGVIAALSPQKSWSANQELAADACNGNVHGHVGAMLTVVRKILEGADPADVINGPKTSNFFRNIADPADPEAVTIDRHAHDIAVGTRYGAADRGLGSPGRYALLAHCYREAALQLGMLPSTLQAITWLVQIESKS